MKTKKILTNIAHIVIFILVAPAACIHIAYRIWYFRHFVIDKLCQKHKQSS